MDECIEGVGVSLLFHDRETRGVAQVSSGNVLPPIANHGGVIRVKTLIPQIPFNPGRYSISVTITEERTGEILLSQHAVKEFQVTGKFFGFTPVQLEGRWEVLQEDSPNNRRVFPISAQESSMCEGGCDG